MLELCNLGKRYGAVWAVRNLNLKLKKGEVFSFLGPNGAGKTTTLKMVAGVLFPTEGKILIDGIDVNEEPEKAKKLTGYIPDVPFLYPQLTGREFLHLVGRIYGMTKKKIENSIEYWKERLEIGEWIDLPSSEYSHGMRQKIVFTQALMHEPSLLIIDEPMVGLDPKSARIVKNIFRELASKGKTVFLSTHTLPVAEEVSDRIGIIEKGRLVAAGTLDELRERYKREGKNLEEIYLEITERSEG
ncbi:ABC transporter ATP-binding protein [bacterium]|nr:MAG: ABC transporter ATP-binding protein [bacterium]